MQENNTKSDDLFTLFHIFDAVIGKKKQLNLETKEQFVRH